VINNQHKYRAAYRHKQAMQIQATYSSHSQNAEEHTAHNGAHDSKNDIEQKPLALFIYDFAGYETGQQA